MKVVKRSMIARKDESMEHWESENSETILHDTEWSIQVITYVETHGDTTQTVIITSTLVNSNY